MDPLAPATKPATPPPTQQTRDTPASVLDLLPYKSPHSMTDKAALDTHVSLHYIARVILHALEYDPIILLRDVVICRPTISCVR